MSVTAATDERTRLAGVESAPDAARLDIVRQGRRSVVSRAFARSPLRLLMPSNHGDAAWVFTSTYGGGLVGGDAVRLIADVAGGATLLLQTQASTKVYRSPRGASSQFAARVGAGGRLLVLPDPTVCFEGAAFEQSQLLDLDIGATLVLTDWMTAGRRASGERWAFDRYVSRVTVRSDGQTVLDDALRLSSGEGPLAARMGRFECVCAIVLVGPDVREHATAAAAQIARLDLRARASLLTSAAPLGRDRDAGCVIRMAGASVEAVAGAVRNYLSFVPGLLGDDPWARKW